jgi:hypothetical protein
MTQHKNTKMTVVMELEINSPQLCEITADARDGEWLLIDAVRHEMQWLEQSGIKVLNHKELTTNQEEVCDE